MHLVDRFCHLLRDSGHSLSPGARFFPWLLDVFYMVPKTLLILMNMGNERLCVYMCVCPRMQKRWDRKETCRENTTCTLFELLLHAEMNDKVNELYESQPVIDGS